MVSDNRGESKGVNAGSNPATSTKQINMKLERYKQNLKVIGSSVYSYDTLVAEIVGTELHKVPWRVNGMTSSPTTSKHVNYVARELNLKLI